MVSGARTGLLCTALLVCAGPTSLFAQPPAKDNPHSKKSTLPFAIGDARAVVLYFIASDCPISNRTLPEMLRVEHVFGDQRVRFFFVYPNSTETPATIATHRAAYGFQPGDQALTDAHEILAHLAGANTTPEAAILVPDGAALKPVYTGRIDDRYLSLGTERPAATRHDLADALTAVLAHQPVPPPGGPPVGCAFMTLAAK